MSKDVRARTGLIGPNAILQMVPVLDQLGGTERRNQILARAGIFELPDGSAMVPETLAARLHRQVRIEEPGLAPALAAYAGKRTADYILAHRIPKPVQLFLKALPIVPSARILSQAIARHAWTFVGSGRFDVVDPMTFEITHNPLIAGERSDACLCYWHAAVFARLYQALVAPSFTCSEVTCGAQDPGQRCRFVLQLEGVPQKLTEVKDRARRAA